MYTDPQAIEADKNLTPERLPGEGQSCVVVPGPSGEPAGCPYPLACADTVCTSPYR
jgi:hypothetical protein